MANILDNLNILDQNLDTAKTTLANNLTAKGVPSTTEDTLTAMADKVAEISGGGGSNEPYPFSEIGYNGTEIPKMQEDIVYAKQIYDTWDVTQTDLYEKFQNDNKLVYMPLVDTSNVTNMGGMFQDCNSLTTVPALNTQNVTNMGSMFRDCKVENIDFLNSKKVCTFYNFCYATYSSYLKTVKVDLSSALDTSNMFYNCGRLTNIQFAGNPSKIEDMTQMFGSDYNHLKENGTLIYDHRYDYSKIINELKKNNPTWTVKLDYEPQECTSLSITADDANGNDTTTTVHYTAMTNGINIFTNERLENVEVKGDGISEDFGMNPSYDASRQVTVTFNYLGQTATTTITQSAKLHESASVDLMSNWELADNSVVPNPDSQIYEGVYQSVHKGQGNVRDKMTITFKGMPTFELYIRSYAESDYDYVFVGRLDQAEPAENDKQASTKGNQQAGTDIGSYTKVEYPNDGGQHTITVIYRKDGGGNKGDDRGYVFFKKPVE